MPKVLYFKDHTIPNTSTVAITKDRVFFYDDLAIHEYLLKDGRTEKLVSTKQPSSISILKDTFLCVLTSNALKIVYNTQVHEIELNGTPIQSFVSGDSLVAVHETCVEIVKINSRTNMPSLIRIETPSVKSMAFNSEFTFILTKDNKVLRTKNLAVTEHFTIPETIKFISNEEYEKIFVTEESLFLVTKSSVQKYKINDTLLRQYTLEMTPDQIQGEYFLGDSLVHLEKAPFQVLNEKVHGIYEQESTLVVLTSNRIYFLIDRNDVDYSPSKEIYEMCEQRTTVNQNLIDIPEFVKDKKQKDQFLNNLVLLKKYESLVKTVKDIDRSLSEREKECELEFQRINKMIEDLGNKTAKIEERVNTLRKRAEKVALKGDAKGFYEKIRIIESLLSTVKIHDLSELKKKLKAQRLILKSRI